MSANWFVMEPQVADAGWVLPFKKEAVMAKDYPKEGGQPGTTDQSPRWEGPEESRPRGYLPAVDDPENDQDAAGETLKNPDRQTLNDAFATKNNAPKPRAADEDQGEPTGLSEKRRG